MKEASTMRGFHHSTFIIHHFSDGGLGLAWPGRWWAQVRGGSSQKSGSPCRLPDEFSSFSAHWMVDVRCWMLDVPDAGPPLSGLESAWLLRACAYHVTT